MGRTIHFPKMMKITLELQRSWINHVIIMSDLIPDHQVSNLLSQEYH